MAHILLKVTETLYLAKATQQDSKKKKKKKTNPTNWTRY